jgi:hypothetical protein
MIQFLSPSASSLEQRVVMLCGGRAPAEVSSRRPRGMWFGFERDYAPCHSTSQNGVPDSFSGNIYAIRRAMGSSERGEFAGCAPMRSLIATVAQTSILAGVICHPVASVDSIGKPDRHLQTSAD